MTPRCTAAATPLTPLTPFSQPTKCSPAPPFSPLSPASQPTKPLRAGLLLAERAEPLSIALLELSMQSDVEDLIDSKGILLLTALHSAVAASCPAARNCMAALANLTSLHDEVRTAVVGAGALPLLVAALEAESASEAATAIGNLCAPPSYFVDRDNQDRLRQLGALERLVTLLDDEQHSHAAARALGSLVVANPDAQAELLAAGGVSPLVARAREGAISPAARNAVSALAACASDRDASFAIAEAGGVGVLVGLLHAQRGCAKNAAFALSCLAAHGEVRIVATILAALAARPPPPAAERETPALARLLSALHILQSAEAQQRQQQLQEERERERERRQQLSSPASALSSPELPPTTPPVPLPLMHKPRSGAASPLVCTETAHSMEIKISPPAAGAPGQQQRGRAPLEGLLEEQLEAAASTLMEEGDALPSDDPAPPAAAGPLEGLQEARAGGD